MACDENCATQSLQLLAEYFLIDGVVLLILVRLHLDDMLSQGDEHILRQQERLAANQLGLSSMGTRQNYHPTFGRDPR